MEILAIFAVAFLAIIGITIFSATKSKSRLKNVPLPKELGIMLENSRPLIQSLDKSLSQAYTANLRNRVLNSHSTWENYDFDWRFFELKRFLVLGNLLKSVPMFSEEVDEVWHEMLMFTRDYEKFSKDFYKEFLHHNPNTDSKPIPGERAFFDWMYISLFEVTANSRTLWGGFLKYPIHIDILNDFKTLTEKKLLEKYFRENDDWLEVKKYLIQKMKAEISESELIKLGKKPLQITRASSDNQIHLLLGAAVYLSLFEADQFESQMNELLPQEWAKVGYGGGSSCSGFSCSGSSDNDSGGGSSCSSCGGGCSS